MDKDKWRVFIATLSTSELERHSADILTFAKEFQQIISAELSDRRNSGYTSNFSTNSSTNTAVQNNPILLDDEEGFDDENIEYEIDDEEDSGVELDFYTINYIQESVSSYDEDTLHERIEKLQDMLSDDLPPVVFKRTQLEKDLCEYRLEEINGTTEQIKENVVCVSCGATLQPTAVFCPKCGTRR